MKAIIIEDEAGNRENLQRMLGRYCPEVELVSSCASAAEGREAIMLHAPAVIFLDIEMPKENGFDLLESLPAIDFEVVFVTAYDQYALQAIKFCALDYLLKPLHAKDLKSAVEKVKERWMARTENQKLRAFLDNIQTPDTQRRLALPTAERVDFVPVDQIVRCQGDNNYTHFFFLNGEKLLVSRTLKEYEELLTPYRFIRIHQSHLIALSQVKSWVKKEGGYIQMKDGTQLPVSQRRREKVLKALTGGR